MQVDVTAADIRLDGMFAGERQGWISRCSGRVRLKIWASDVCERRAQGQPGDMTSRIQLSRRRKLPDYAVSVAYPTKWANPYRPEVRNRGANLAAVRLYRKHLARHPELLKAARDELAGKDLACWCPTDLPCHADILLQVANSLGAEND